MNNKILIALSGGVDSAVAAHLMKEQGYAVSAAYMRTWMDEEEAGLFANCPWEEDIASAQAVAAHLNIPFEVVNLIEKYRQEIVTYLVDGYRNGITPNPDIMCNRKMKFGVFREYAEKEGFSGIATGHYCQKIKNDEGSCDIEEGLDSNKDQSYFLAMVEQNQIRNAHFPLGKLHKQEVRDIADKIKLPNAKRKDSQGICFLGKVKIRDFLAQYIEHNPGNIIRQSDKKVLGQHNGLHHFTLGQRRGIGIPSNTDHKNYVVVAQNYKSNELIVAFEEAETPGLYQTKVRLRDLSWVNKPIHQNCHLLAKPRYRDPSQPIKFKLDSDGKAQITFELKQRALAQGQVLALYNGKRLLGGGYYY